MDFPNNQKMREQRTPNENWNNNQMAKSAQFSDYYDGRKNMDMELNNYPKRTDDKFMSNTEYNDNYCDYFGDANKMDNKCNDYNNERRNNDYNDYNNYNGERGNNNYEYDEYNNYNDERRNGDY